MENQMKIVQNVFVILEHIGLLKVIAKFVQRVKMEEIEIMILVIQIVHVLIIGRLKIIVNLAI